jgi:hypothetical protein
MRRLCLALLLVLGCAGPRKVRIRPVTQRDLSGVIFLPFAASEVDGFFEEHGQPCPRFNGEIKEYFAGWHSGKEEEPICDHDTFDDTIKPAMLTMRWHGTVPADGGWSVVSGGYAVGAWGRVLARGATRGDYFALARVVLEAKTPHCQAEWSEQVALAKITGSYTRGAAFSGWIELPDLKLAGCVAGDPIDVRLRLVGESNRGRIEVDAFGFSTAAADELNQMFGVRPAVALH